MMMMSLMSLIFCFCFCLPFAIQPLGLGSILLCLSFLFSLIVFFSSSSWFGFVLFLIYIGGMLVMFAYVTALMPNLMLGGKKMLNCIFFLFFFWLLMLGMSELLGVSEEGEGSFFFNLDILLNFLGGSLFSSFNFFCITGLVSVLFIVLLCVVKICYFSNGPLRPYSLYA
uniref:NADH dehydrogenase subunit 6 n=1 Tax=Plaxiphora tricolor TaxID=2045497 RepID=UPI002E7A0C38|nr:NADH dehydrogenase subunit 6 [Plaxiphora tricolor]WRI60246.1 NADH dehydrogenase subunit 6 [Plaxiphora tricolor]